MLPAVLRPAPKDEPSELPFETLDWLPVYVAYAGIGLLLLTLALAAYALLTPTREFRALRDGNGAAALSLAGAMLGLAWPLAGAMQRAETLSDLLIWSTAVLLVQLLAVLSVRRIAPAFDRALATGSWASAIFLATLSVTIGLLNAAAIR